MGDAWVGAIGALLGAVVAGVLALAIQSQGDRSARAREDRARVEGRRLELRQAAREFVVATQEMERVAGSPEIDGVERGVVSARMWAAYKSLVLLCPQEVRDVAAEYANALGDVMWNGAAGEQQVWEPLWAPSNAFGEAIRKWTGADVDWPSDDR